MAGKNPGSRHSPPSRATLSAIGYIATLAPASPARTAGGEPPASDHRQTATDSLPGPDSFRFGGGPDPDPAPLPHQATALDLQRTGVGNPRQRRIPLRARPSAAPQKAGVHSRPQQGSQP